jgi:hypothetical protein
MKRKRPPQQRKVSSFFTKSPVKTGSAVANHTVIVIDSSSEEEDDDDDDQEVIVIDHHPTNDNATTTHRTPPPPPPPTTTPYRLVALTFEKIAANQSRLYIVATLTQMFLTVLQHNPSSLYNVVLLCGNLGDLKIGGGLLSQSICDALGVQRKTLSSAYTELAVKTKPFRTHVDAVYIC